jgi:hypothetical protein
LWTGFQYMNSGGEGGEGDKSMHCAGPLWF